MIWFIHVKSQGKVEKSLYSFPGLIVMSGLVQLWGRFREYYFELNLFGIIFSLSALFPSLGKTYV